MAVSLNTNILALGNQRELNKITKELHNTFIQASSGKRINKASDDAAGQAIAAALSAEFNVGGVAARNISDGISAISIADGALQSAADITSRMGELATQAANGTLSDSQRDSLNNEFQSLKSELDRISGTTTFNGASLFGSTTTIQSGTDGSSDSKSTVSFGSVSSTSLGIASADISTQAGAQAAIDSTKAAVTSIANTRGELGAAESRLSTEYENLQTLRINQKEAESRIVDADFAEVSAKLTANKIKQNITAALGAQANNSLVNIAKQLQ